MLNAEEIAAQFPQDVIKRAIELKEEANKKKK